MTVEPETVEKPRRGRPPGARTERPAPHRGRHRDLTLAIKAVKDAGVENFRVTVDRMGTISVVPLAPVDLAQHKGPTNGTKC